MITKKDIIADLHTHTIASEHAYSTIKENINSARWNGIKYLAVTDHYYNKGNTLDKKNEGGRIAYVERINNVEKNVTIISGAEFNLNQKVPNWDKVGDVRWRPIGLHNWFVNTKKLTLDNVYDMFIMAALTRKHNAFAHIERELHKVNGGKHGQMDYYIRKFLKKMVKFAKENDIPLEVNESSLVTNECGGAKRLEFWLDLARENENIIYLGSDAHYCDEVGVFTKSIELLNKLDYPKELILNCNEDLLKKRLNLK